jgi:hypothetical protein
MRLPVPALLLALVMATAAPNPSVAQSDDIEMTIRSQIDAFLADDFATAFTFASPTIKGVFGSPENFGAMVRQGYPMVYRPSDVKMLERREVGGAMVQRVLVTDAAGKTHVLDYQMIETAEGWQINGVQLLPGVGVGA